MAKHDNKITLTLDDVGDFLGKLTEHSEHVYWISSHDFKKIQYISPSYERIWGRPREDLYKKPEIWIDFLHPEDAMSHHPIDEMARKVKELGDKARYSEDYRIIRPDGEIRWIMDRGFPLCNEQGECYGVTGIAIDVTDKKRQEEALRIAKDIAEKASRTKDEFIQNMSHDIRTPLVGIIGMAQLIEQKMNKSRDKAYARMIARSGEQLLDLLDGILNSVSVGSKEKSLDMHSFDLYELIDSICELERPTIKFKKLDFDLIIAPNVPRWIITDPIKLHRIILNLLSNAIKFTKQGFIKIEVNARALEAGRELELEIIVSDSGVGIPEAEQNKIFNRFYKSDTFEKETDAGHGVGLYIVQQYLDLLKGTISCESGEQKGSFFKCNIPVVHDTMKKKSSISSHALPSSDKFSFLETINESASYHEQTATKERPLVLLVEDNPILLLMIESLVKQANADCISASSAEKAMDLYLAHAFDFVITDIGLPGISGYEMAQAMRTHQKQFNKPLIPIIGLTAHVLDTVEQKCLDSGMNKVIMKPINIKLLNALFAPFFLNDKTHTPEQMHYDLVNDLPNTKEALFDLERYALLEKRQGQHLAYQIKQLESFIEKSLPNHIKTIDQAYAHKKWFEVEQLIVKIKKEAQLCGATRLTYACQYFEHGYKADYVDVLDALYRQFSTIVTQTILIAFEQLAKA